MNGLRFPDIADHGLIGDMQTAALVATDATIDWLCVPRFDSPSVFASLLDAKRGGHWRMTPTCAIAKTGQFYFPDSNVLITRFLTENGVVEVQDFMPVGPVDRETESALVRRVIAVRGSMELRTEVRPRFDYGRYAATVECPADPHELIFVHDDGRLKLRASIELEPEAEQANATFSLDEGDTVAFVMERDGARSHIFRMWPTVRLRASTRRSRSGATGSRAVAIADAGARWSSDRH